MAAGRLAGRQAGSTGRAEGRKGGRKESLRNLRYGYVRIAAASGRQREGARFQVPQYFLVFHQMQQQQRQHSEGRSLMGLSVRLCFYHIPIKLHRFMALSHAPTRFEHQTQIKGGLIPSLGFLERVREINHNHSWNRNK